MPGWERQGRFIVHVVERLGVCTLTLWLVWQGLQQLGHLAGFVQGHHARVVEGQAHLDETLTPQAVLLRTICRGMARAEAWPEQYARECDVSIPSPMTPDRLKAIPDLVVGESERAIGG